MKNVHTDVVLVQNINLKWLLLKVALYNISKVSKATKTIRLTCLQYMCFLAAADKRK